MTEHKKDALGGSYNMECLEEALQNAAKRRAFIRRWAKKLGVPVINLRLPACSVADAKGFPVRFPKALRLREDGTDA